MPPEEKNMKYEGLSDELVKRLENLPPPEPRSRLEPLRELILAWRQQGRSYRRIQQLLREHCKVDVAYETLRRFVQRRERPDWPAVETETVPSPVTPVSTASMDRYAEARERMRQLKAQPVVSPPARRKVFDVSEDDLDPTKPLKMLPEK
jgi:hypothetical protein